MRNSKSSDFLTTREAAAACQKWNNENAIGTSVIVVLDNGGVLATKTRSAAYVSDAGIAVIFVDSISGYFLLSRIHKEGE